MTIAIAHGLGSLLRPRVRSTAINVSVSLFVCRSVRWHFSKPHTQISPNFLRRLAETVARFWGSRVFSVSSDVTSCSLSIPEAIKNSCRPGIQLLFHGRNNDSWEQRNLMQPFEPQPTGKLMMSRISGICSKSIPKFNQLFSGL